MSFACITDEWLHFLHRYMDKLFLAKVSSWERKIPFLCIDLYHGEVSMNKINKPSEAWKTTIKDLLQHIASSKWYWLKQRFGGEPAKGGRVSKKKFPKNTTRWTCTVTDLNTLKERKGILLPLLGHVKKMRPNKNCVVSVNFPVSFSFFSPTIAMLRSLATATRTGKAVVRPAALQAAVCVTN